jgi:uroporphyrinogen decarboxylase
MAFVPVAIHESLFEGMTMSRVAYYMRKNPQFIHEVLNEYTKLNIEVIKRFHEAGVDIVFYSDDLGYKGRSILSIEQFKKFILPYYKKLYKACEQRGMFIVQHSCGFIDKNLPYMVEAGLNCIQALEPAAGVDLAHLKQSFGHKLSFMGGIDSSRILKFGTPDDIVQEVKRCVKSAGYNGGYFVGPSHNILNAPWENIKVLRNAIEKYRKYNHRKL